jgi:alkyl sulfatase BDS1-like metallo-beta-lactamase superfamily hydrolase
MTTNRDSFEPGNVATGPRGQQAHPEALAQVDRLQLKLHQVTDSVWSLVGNGLSNQSFIKAPEGLIAIDSGECVEEMQQALTHMRAHTDIPVVACIYTHFHYVAGTAALIPETPSGELEIWGHSGIGANLARFGGEIAPRSGRGLVHQFGLTLPTEGPDGLVSCGLGLFYRNPGHAPYTPGYLPANHTFEEPTSALIAGLRVELMPAPSDATDSVTLWFPELGVCVNNLVWPALFNIFAIRGEEYRDPRILLRGLDQILALEPEHLVGTHGPPLSGRARIRAEVTRYRDSIQFIWDQTVRGANRGMTADQIAATLRLPEQFSDSYMTRPLYGVVEHHVRQICAGLFGWFDEDVTRLFPLPPTERADRLVDGFGGVEAVREQIDSAIAKDDWRWALELSGWLTQHRDDGGQEQDRGRLAKALRGIAYSTPSANIRNWCLTRALEADGSSDLSRFRTHRFRVNEVAAGAPELFVPLLRVQLDPERATNVEGSVAFAFDTGTRAGLTIRNCVAVPNDGTDADVTLQISHSEWSQLLGGKTTLRALLQAGTSVDGDPGLLEQLLGCFDLDALRHRS